MAQQPGLVDWLFFSGARDETGAPVSSGSVYFYAAHSTSVLIDVFSDDVATPIVQPVALDAAGRATVYIRDMCEVKVLDAAGATKLLINNASVVPSTLVSTLRGGVGSTLDVDLATINAALAVQAAIVPSETYSVNVRSGTNPAFEFDPTRTLNVMKTTYAGAMGTPTIAWPVPSPALVKGTRYRFLIQNGSGTATTITFPSQITHSWGQAGSPTAMAANTYYTAEFMVTDDQAHLFQSSAWWSYGGNVW